MFLQEKWDGLLEEEEPLSGQSRNHASKSNLCRQICLICSFVGCAVPIFKCQYTFFYCLQHDNSIFFSFLINAFDSAEIITGGARGPPDKVSFLIK